MKRAPTKRILRVDTVEGRRNINWYIETDEKSQKAKSLISDEVIYKCPHWESTGDIIDVSKVMNIIEKKNSTSVWFEYGNIELGIDIQKKEIILSKVPENATKEGIVIQ